MTAEKGFADLRTHRPETSAGVLLFRLDEESLRGYMELAKVALQQLDLERLAGAVIVVTPR